MLEKYVTYIGVAQLKAAMLFAAKEDIRSYLVGVCVEHNPNGARLVATDGHRLICINLGPGADDESSKASATVRYVVDADVIASAIKLYGKQTAVRFTYERDHTSDPERNGVTCISAARVKVGEISTTDKQETMGTFPDYTRAIPSQISGGLAQFNSAYVHDCTKAKSFLIGRPISQNVAVAVAHNGESAALVGLTDDAFAIVMPMRNSPTTDLPEWYSGKAVAA